MEIRIFLIRLFTRKFGYSHATYNNSFIILTQSKPIVYMRILQIVCFCAPLGLVCWDF